MGYFVLKRQILGVNDDNLNKSSNSIKLLRTFYFRSKAILGLHQGYNTLILMSLSWARNEFFTHLSQIYSDVDFIELQTTRDWGTLPPFLCTINRKLDGMSFAWIIDVTKIAVLAMDDIGLIWAKNITRVSSQLAVSFASLRLGDSFSACCGGRNIFTVCYIEINWR